MAILGAHMSIAGGYYKAADNAGELGMNCVQLFTKNNNQWAGKPITDEEARQFHESLPRNKLSHSCAHASYLINLASPDNALWEKSVDALIIEIQRCEQLGIPGLVLHPGSSVKSTAEEGQKQVIAALDRVHQETRGVATQVWLETTAGQGSCLGATFDELAILIDGVREPERLGICIDTCHLFAAGYPLDADGGFEQTFEKFETLLGFNRLKACHVNDSAKAFGSRVDRHAHIGEGHLGVEPFRLLLADSRFAEIPMYLETEKGERDGESLDAINLRTLRSLIASTPSKAKPRTPRRKA